MHSESLTALVISICKSLKRQPIIFSTKISLLLFSNIKFKDSYWSNISVASFFLYRYKGSPIETVLRQDI